MIGIDHIQGEIIRLKMQLLLEAIVENMTDNDEALDKRETEELTHKDGFEVTMPAHLGYYWSTGTGTPMIDKLVERQLALQADEWKRQYPTRASLPDCCDDASEFSDEAQEWELAAFEDETIYAEIGIYRENGEIHFSACFMDEINAPYEERYQETMDEKAFLILADQDLEALADRISEAPYLTTITKRNSGGRWHGWFGTDNGKTAYYSTGGHPSEATARADVERMMRQST